ncbi:MAG TPA: O-antigen ligase family protein, partial [Tepidisphaeraceae bacterium]|nr:O-antigen ligase family protein [Tepidisphaeraceae bacterium]
GGLMAFMFVMAVCFLMRPRSIVPWRMFSMIGAMMFILAVTGISIDINGGKDRTISFSQVVENVSSILGSSKATGLDATKEWRKNWWNDIIGYTVHGPYFWGGKGFGINLADDDGYQVEADASLRSPHSIHFSMLARGGVPMAFLWALLLFTWGFGIAWGHLTAKRRGELRWASVFLFIGCYWAAFLINASFDVFLEGPMGGIWFWTVYGVGIACLYLYKNQPRALQY